MSLLRPMSHVLLRSREVNISAALETAPLAPVAKTIYYVLPSLFDIVCFAVWYTVFYIHIILSMLVVHQHVGADPVFFN